MSPLIEDLNMMIDVHIQPRVLIVNRNISDRDTVNQKCKQKVIGGGGGN